jgi:hypothetical protein
MGGSSAAARGGSKKKNKKNHGANKPHAGALIAAAAVAGGQNPCGKRPRQQRSYPGSCPVHPGACNSASECREIQKLVERVSKRREQASKDDSSPPRRSGKEKVSDADAAAAEKKFGYQTPKKTLRVSSTSSTPSPGVMSAPKSYTSCTAAARSSSPRGTSRPFAGKFSR